MPALFLGLGLGFLTGAVWAVLGLWGLRLVLRQPPPFLRIALGHLPLPVLVTPFVLQIIGVGGLIGMGAGALWGAYGDARLTLPMMVIGVGVALALPALLLMALVRPARWQVMLGWGVGVVLLGILLPTLA
ncbi:MAG: hypothetical protein NZ951_08230 [Dehalococcoidia bacterium]|nr:hypothetical protein [Dehalococcoidia bacterium]MDW8120434.1 hypothetical protein [Chloroflexota bacterium]